MVNNNLVALVKVVTQIWVETLGVDVGTIDANVSLQEMWARLGYNMQVEANKEAGWVDLVLYNGDQVRAGARVSFKNRRKSNVDIFWSNEERNNLDVMQ